MMVQKVQLVVVAAVPIMKAGLNQEWNNHQEELSKPVKYNNVSYKQN